MPVYQYEISLIASKFGWAPSEYEDMSISERRTYFKLVRAILEAERPKKE